MSMFPGPGAQIYHNEVGEVLGWDYPPDEPNDPYDDPYYADRADAWAEEQAEREAEAHEEYCGYCEEHGHASEFCPEADDPHEELCGAGGQHHYRQMTEYDLGPGRYPGVYCEECGAPAPRTDDD
jgi:hypothetical protein